MVGVPPAPDCHLIEERHGNGFQGDDQQGQDDREEQVSAGPLQTGKGIGGHGVDADAGGHKGCIDKKGVEQKAGEVDPGKDVPVIVQGYGIREKALHGA